MSLADPFQWAATPETISRAVTHGKWVYGLQSGPGAAASVVPVGPVLPSSGLNIAQERRMPILDPAVEPPEGKYPGGGGAEVVAE